VAGAITTAITITATNSDPVTSIATSAPSTVTVTAPPAQPPAPLPAAQADAQTCRAWSATDTLVTAAAVAQGVVPQGTTITDPAVQTNPAWKAGVIKAGEIYDQAAETLSTQIAPGTKPMLAQTAGTTASTLRTLAESYRTFDPANGNAMAVFHASQQTMDWLCQ